MKNIKRRSFIKNTSIITGGLVLPSFSLKKNKIDFSKKLKIAVVGCGGRGTGAAVQALRADKNVELIAMCDAFKDRLEGSLKSIQEEEKKFLEAITEKYGAGSLNSETGVFTPVENKS